MTDPADLRPTLRQRAADVLRRLPPPEREALLVKCWMSHDARWFMAAAREYGLPATNRLNQAAAREAGHVEARRITRALRLPPVTSLDDYLLAQEIFIGLLGPDLLAYRLRKVSDEAYEVHVARCFAHEHATTAGIAEWYDCGVFARLTGWLDALGWTYRVSPPLGKCLKARGKECVYTITLLNGPGHPVAGCPGRGGSDD